MSPSSTPNFTGFMAGMSIRRCCIGYRAGKWRYKRCWIGTNRLGKHHWCGVVAATPYYQAVRNFSENEWRFQKELIRTEHTGNNRHILASIHTRRTA